MSENAVDLVGTTLDGKYEVLRRLGEGGMGVVYEALHLGINRHCAIKVLRPDETQHNEEALARFKLEAEVTGSLGHPNIIQVTDIGKTPTGAPYLVMEFLKGKSLAEAIDQQGPLALDWAVTIIIHVLDALAVVHHEGVIHRDLKPDNIFLAEMGRPDRPKTVVKVLDFGLAKPVNLTLGENKITRLGFTMGTPFYMPPEQARAQGVDARSDLFAAGVTLYEMLTAALPYEGNTFYDLVAAMTAGNPLPPSSHRPEVPAELDAVILKAIANEQEDRYQNADKFIEALAPFAPAGLVESLHTSRWRVPIFEAGALPGLPGEGEGADSDSVFGQTLPKINASPSGAAAARPSAKRLPRADASVRAQVLSSKSRVPDGRRGKIWASLAGTFLVLGLVAGVLYQVFRDKAPPAHGAPPMAAQVGVSPPPQPVTDTGPVRRNAGPAPAEVGDAGDAVAADGDRAAEGAEAAPPVEAERDAVHRHKTRPRPEPETPPEGRLGFETDLPPPPPTKRLSADTELPAPEKAP
jgi:serine/threonine-protein kinase